MTQVLHPLENAYVYQNIMILINRQSALNPQISTYMKNTFNISLPENDCRTLIINNSELYHLSYIENIFVLYSIDQKWHEPTDRILNHVSEYIISILKEKYKFPPFSNLVSTKLCCYLPLDKPIPIGFIRYADNQSVDLYQNILPSSNMSLFVKTFECDDQWNFKIIPDLKYTSSIPQNPVAVLPKPVVAPAPMFGSIAPLFSTKPMYTFGSK